jgi:hypothetical protein
MNRKRLVITEDERREIRKSYNISEQNDDLDIGRGLVKSLLSKLMGSEDSNKSGEEGESETSSSYDGESKISEKGQELLNNPTFQKKLDDISNSIGIDKSSIIKLMKHESSLNPNIKNNIGCVGLIQFCPDVDGGTTKTIGGTVYRLEDLRNDLNKQMDAIKEFWLTGYKSGKIKEPRDLYIYNFLPIAAGKPDNFVLQTKKYSPKTIAKSNPVFNRTLGRPLETPITVGDLDRYYKKTGMV